MAIELCLGRNIPFAAYSFPGEERITFFSNPSGVAVISDRRFSIVPWLADGSAVISINDEFDASETLKQLVNLAPFKASGCVPWKKSTVKEVYRENIAELIEILAETSGKAVISRVEAMPLPDFDFSDWSHVAMSVLNSHRDAFGFIYYTYQTGAWIGATPEKLLEVDRQSGHFLTMALAGTRKFSLTPSPWDHKNLQEHRYVADYILDRLSSLGLHVFKAPVVTLRAGGVEHLMTAIRGDSMRIDANIIVHALNPTPAIAGWPLDQALGQIAVFEDHPRYCYGGYVTVEDDQSFRSYVNLRSMHICEKSCCLYGGGGITALSDPLGEWEETAMKIATMRGFISEKRMS